MIKESNEDSSIKPEQNKVHKYNQAIKILKYCIENNSTLLEAQSAFNTHEAFIRKFKAKHLSKFEDQEIKEFNDLYSKAVNSKLYKTNITSNSSVEKEEEFDERSKYWVTRDESGKIIDYQFLILIKNEPDFRGSLTREQMEMIYQYYPYVTRNTVSSYFPYLTFVQLKRVLRTFNITKDKLFPIHILEEHTETEIAEFALKNKEKAALDKIVEKKSSFIEKKYFEAQEHIHDLKNSRKFIEETIAKYFTNDKTNFKKIISSPNKNSDVCYVFYSDIHYGKKYDKPRFGRGFNKDIAHERMLQIAEKTVKYIKDNSLCSLFILFGGDLLESIQPEGMHPAHLKTMDLVGDEQLFFAVESQITFLRELRSNMGNEFPIHITYLAGNHDRIGVKRDDDLTRTAGQIAFKIIEMEFKNDPYLNFDIPRKPSYIKTIENENKNLCVIAHHGDNGLAKKKPSELVNLFGIGNSGYHLILNGHWHSSQVTYESGTNFMQISLPSVCSVDEFILDNLGNNQLPGFVIGMSENQGFSYSNIVLY